MALGTAAPTAATPLRAPLTGLLRSPATRVRQVSAGSRAEEDQFGLGWTWQTELHQASSEFMVAMAAGCSITMPTNGADDKAPLESAYPFTIATGDWCTAFGYEARDYEGRARRLLDATRSFLIAREVWNGTVATAQVLDNVWLAKSTSVDVTAAAVAPNKALARLDREGVQGLFNQPFAIHADPEVYDRLLDTNSLYRDGDAWRTANGTVVVSDGGYDGHQDGATGGSRWMVAVPIMDVILGPVHAMGLNTPDDWQAAFDKAVNSVVLWAQQDVIVKYEPVLLHAAAQVDLT